MTTEERIEPTELAGPLTGSTLEGGIASFATGRITQLSAAPPALPASVFTTPAPFNYRPTTFEGALRLADLMASSQLVPTAYRGKPADVFVAMQWGNELDLGPLQAVQSIAVINGRPGLYGDAGKALLLSKGCQIEEAGPEEVRQQGIARCTITRKGRPPVTRTFSVEDAQTAKLWGKEGPWRNYPWRMLAWRAFWLTARDAAADMLKGMGGIEELADIEPMQPAPPRVEAPKPKSRLKEGDPIGDAIGKKALPPLEPDEAEANHTPASPAMIAHIKKLLERNALSTSDVHKRFPEVAETLEGVTVAQTNAILKWVANPTE